MAEDNGISYVASGEKQRLQRAADRAAANAPRDPDNLFSLTTTNLRSMLSQRAINRGATIEIID